MADFYRSTLPYDYARCQGNADTKCTDCLRRITIATDKGEGWYSYLMPAAENNECPNYIKQGKTT